MVKTVKVTGYAYHQNGEPAANAKGVAILSQYELDDGVVVPHQIVFRTDEVGSFNIDLWPNERGTGKSFYEVIIYHKSPEPFEALIYVPDEDHDVRFKDILVQLPPPPISDAERILQEVMSNAYASSVSASESADSATIATNKAQDAANSASATKDIADDSAKSANIAATLRDETASLRQQTHSLKENADASASAALASQNAAKTSETNSKASEVAAKASEDSASASATTATTKASEASTSAQESADSAASIVGAVTESQEAVSNSQASATAAATSASDAIDSSKLAKDWAIKVGGTVDGVDYSAKYWAMEAENTVTSGTLVVTEDSPSISFTGVGSSGDPLTAGVIFGTTSGTAAQGDDSRITGAVQKDANLDDLTDVTIARSNLGLGSAATRDVGASSGQLMEVGAFGLGSVSVFDPDITLEAQHINGFGTALHENRVPSDAPDGIIGKVLYVGDADWGTQLWFSYHEGKAWFRNKESGKPYESWKEFIHSGNTTVDSNGFIKTASPILKLFSDRIEKTEHLEIAEAELERVGVGHYVLKKVPLLSIDGWYIETPKDRNSNIYFYLDYEEDEDSKTLTIKTYDPDYSSGRAEAGEPVDILEGRFVTLRFSEDPSLYESDRSKEEDK